MPRLVDAVRIAVLGVTISAGWLSAAPLSVSADPAGSTERLQELRLRVREDRYDVGARRNLADLLEGTEDIELRREAAEALREGLTLEAEDPDLWMRFARLQERRGFHQEAHDAYREALRLAPDRWDFWDAVARHEFLRFQRQLLWTHLEESARANRRVLEMKPGRVPALRRGLRLAMIRGDRPAVDSLCTVWEKAEPDDAWPVLVRGMLLADAGEWEFAEAAFRRGINRLPEEDRRAFFRLDRIDPREENRRAESPDTLRFFRDYWQWRDPTPADLVNPLLVEHYRRLVEAELLFALESQGVRGWEHAPGEMIVRYGLPPQWTFLGGVARVEEYRVGSTMSAPTIEVLFGQDGWLFPLRFVDYNLNGRYFAPIEGFPRELELDLAETPSVYASPFLAPEKGQEVEIWRFLDPEGKGRIEIGVALDPEEWPAEILDRPYRLSSRLTVYDAHWTPGDAMVASWAPFSIDPLGRLVARFELAGNPDTLVLGLETSDRQEKGRAAGYSSLGPSMPATGLPMSDLAFLSGVTFQDPGGAYGWGYGSGVPNPGHFYRSRDPVGIAFEAYNLAVKEDGECRGRIRVSVARETGAGWLGVVLGRGRNRGEAELVFDASESGATLHQLLALELPPLKPGRYLLRARVEDTGSSRAAERTGTFQVLEPGKTP
jgi:GWxTD domain-containing protein